MILEIGATLLCGIALAHLVYRRTLLGVLIGLQLLGYSTVLFWSGRSAQMNGFPFFSTVVCVLFMIAGLSFALRLFYLKRSSQLKEIEELKF